MEEICPHIKCTGCYACENICPTHCIEMKPDKLGAIHPHINQEKCINCNLCKSVCPNNKKLNFRQPSACYAAWRTETDARTLSASGGIGALMSEYIVRNGGVVFGTKYDDQLTPITTSSSNYTDIEAFKGSKYVISLVGKAFSSIKEMLIDGKDVLYIATPCQIAGLKSFLKKDFDNLITVDLICHGVCPSSYFNEEISHIAKKKRIKNISNISFRGNGKKNGRLLNFHLTIFDGEKIVYNKPADWQYYFAGFLKGITLRENCYSCIYARPERISDITIGDFIGLGLDKHFNGPKINTSSVIVNSVKGASFINKLSEYAQSRLCLIKRDYNEAVKYGPSLRAPFPKHALADCFQNLYPRKGFVKSIRIVLGWTIFKDKLHRLFIRAPKKLWKLALSILSKQ